MDKLQWGNRKAPRRVKMKDSSVNGKSNGGFAKEKTTATVGVVVVDNGKDSTTRKEGRDPTPIHPPNRSSANDNRKASSPSKKEDRSSTKRGASGVCNESSKLSGKEDNQKFVWPRLLISLSNKEKEEDFMIMKGCKPSQRPKKRAKGAQRAILAASPGAWLSDVCRERYEVREKKTNKKKPRGLKAMGGMEFESE